MNINPEEWTATELFNFLVASSVIDPDDKFEDWMNDRADMIKMAKEELSSNL